MTCVEVLAPLSDADRRAVTALLAAVEQRLGRRPLSDQAWLDFVDPERHRLVAVVARDDSGELVAYGQASQGRDSWSIEVVGHSGSESDGPAPSGPLTTELLTALIDAIAAAGGGRARWWAVSADERSRRTARAAGLVPERVLLQMRVDLPLASPDDTASVETRPFRPGIDEAAWLEVNNAAFHWHPEQGGWGPAEVRRRITEPWFEATGFLLHERQGRLAAFCWTKVHRDVEPPIGEIYVIGVHPDFRGAGLGHALTVAGLASMAARGVTTGMLYVDATNEPAVTLYRRLGFTTYAENHAYVVDVPEAVVDAPTETTTGGSR